MAEEEKVQDQAESTEQDQEQENLSRDDYLFLTQIYEKASSYDGMLLGIKKCIEINSKLSKEERRLFSIAYANSVSKNRRNLRYINHELKKAEKNPDQNSNQLAILGEMKSNLEKDIATTCEEVQNLIDEELFPVLEENQIEEKIFYLKMKADYYRYLCEILTEENFENIAGEADNCYQQAIAAANEALPISSPVRLGLSLNYSVFCAEIKKNKEEAIEIAKKAFDGAMSSLEELEKKKNKEVLFLVKMMEENMKLWESK